MWKRFVLTTLLTSLAGLALTYLFVLAVDPYGVSPLRLVSSEHVPATQRRFIVPGIVRNPRFDTFIMGTSTMAPIDPSWVEAEFGGTAANVAIHGGMPYEQSRAVGLALRRTPAPRLVLFGIDAVWCSDVPIPNYHPVAQFPDWLYADALLPQLANLLNWRSIDAAKRKIDAARGKSSSPTPANGFVDQLPPDEQWTSEKARKLVANFSEPVPPKAMPASWTLPEVTRLDGVLGDLKPETRLVLVLMPAFQLKARDPVNEARIATCKGRMADVARAHGAKLVDFAFANRLTTTPENFWDSEHFRNPTSRALPGWIGQALASPPGTVTELYRVP